MPAAGVAVALGVAELVPVGVTVCVPATPPNANIGMAPAAASPATTRRRRMDLCMLHLSFTKVLPARILLRLSTAYQVGAIGRVRARREVRTAKDTKNAKNAKQISVESRRAQGCLPGRRAGLGRYSKQQSWRLDVPTNRQG